MYHAIQNPSSNSSDITPEIPLLAIPSFFSIFLENFDKGLGCNFKANGWYDIGDYARHFNSRNFLECINISFLASFSFNETQHLNVWSWPGLSAGGWNTIVHAVHALCNICAFVHCMWKTLKPYNTAFDWPIFLPSRPMSSLNLLL